MEWCNNCIWVYDFSSVWKDGSQNHTVIKSLLERVQIHKNAGKPKDLSELNDFCEEKQTLTVQDKQETHEQLSLNKHTAVDHSGNNTVLRINRM